MNEEGFYPIPVVVTEEHLKTVAVCIRLFSGLSLTERFNPILVMEHVFPEFDRKFSLKIVARGEWFLTEEIPACVEPETHTVYLREDLYDSAVDGESLAVTTVTHEVAHCIYFLIFGVPKNIEFEEINGRKISLSHEMEIMADALMEFLSCPEEVNFERSESEVLEAYVVRPLVKLLVTIIKKCVFDSMMKIAVERLPQKKTA